MKNTPKYAAPLLGTSLTFSGLKAAQAFSLSDTITPIDLMVIEVTYYFIVTSEGNSTLKLSGTPVERGLTFSGLSAIQAFSLNA